MPDYLSLPHSDILTKKLRDQLLMLFLEKGNLAIQWIHLWHFFCGAIVRQNVFAVDDMLEFHIQQAVGVKNLIHPLV